jgi:hypothetical protein
MNSKRMIVVSIVGALALVGLLLAATGVWAESDAQGSAAPLAQADVVSGTISYQGRLLDVEGNPVDSMRWMTFTGKSQDAPACGRGGMGGGARGGPPPPPPQDGFFLMKPRPVAGELHCHLVLVSTDRGPVFKSTIVAISLQSMPRSTVVSATASGMPVIMVCVPLSRAAWMVLLR